MIWLQGLSLPTILVLVFAVITLPAALVAAAIGVGFVRSAARPGPRGLRVLRRILGGLLVGYAVGDVAVLVYLLAFRSGDLLPTPG